MRLSKIIILCICVLPLAFTDARAKDWRGIAPLHSTCADVKRILNVADCDPPVFDVGSDIVNITFSEKPCADGWNVPKGTVISLRVFPRNKPQLKDLQIDLETYEKTTSDDRPDVTYYLNVEEGISIELTPDGKVESITYGPTAKDSYLRYPKWMAGQPVADSDPHGIIKFDEYGDLSINAERKRLDDFALQLRHDPNTQGYIIGYAGRRAHAGEAMVRVERARKYLTNVRGIKDDRIATMDGGHREELNMELFIGAKGGAAPLPSPTLCPSEVQIIKTGSVKNRSRRLTRPR
ncbi:MAG TPA: hypothetical protein VF544_09630 [Pyrinomonadaceae bacterium]|jgi:hypothetical protein